MLKPGSLALTAALGLLSSIGPMSTDMYLPSLPDLVRSLGGTTAQGQLTISSYLIGFALGQLVYGPLSDRFGRKPILILAVCVYCAATLLCALAWSIDMLIAARVLQAFGGCGAIVLARAIIRDLYEGARAGREMSILAMVMGATPILAPIVGGVLHTYVGWRGNFALQLIAGIEAVALVVWYLPETLRERSAQALSANSMAQSYVAICRNAPFLAHTAIIVFAYSGLFAWISVAAFVLQDIYRLSPVSFSIAFSCGAAGFITGTTIASRIVVRLGLGKVIGLGCAAMATGGTIMIALVALHADNAWSLAAAFALYLIGLGLVLPQATAAALMPFPERAGTASSLVGFVQQAGAAVCGSWVGHVLGDNAWPLVIAIAVMGWAALVTWTLTRRVRTAA